MENLLKDARYGIRTLIKNPGFTLIAIFTLALGIGANTAIFSVVNAFLLKRIPYQDPDRLFWAERVMPQGSSEPIPGPFFIEWREQNRVFDHIAAYDNDNLTLTGAGDPERLEVGLVSADFFPLLGVQPALGRNFFPAEDKVDGGHVAIISHGLWRRRFSSSREVIGKAVSLDDKSYTIIGVLPPDFRFFQAFDLWTPLALNPEQERGGQVFSLLKVIGRLKSGVTAERALSELEAIARSYKEGMPNTKSSFDGQVRLISLHKKLAGNMRLALLVLLGAVGMILLISCANVANLLLVRAASRQKEVAIRAALGASRSRLIQQMLIESLMLAGSGGALGLVLALWVTKSVLALNSGQVFGDLSLLTEMTVDLNVLGFTLAVSLLTGALFGLAPALQFSRINLNDLLKEGWQGSSGGLYHGKLRQLLMVAEVALTIVLLVGAGLLVRSFLKLQEVRLGFDPRSMLTLRVSLPGPRYEDKARRQAFFQQALQGLASLPGVESVGAINHLPLMDYTLAGRLSAEGASGSQGAKNVSAQIGLVSEGYFRTMGIPLREGRAFVESDEAESPKVVIVNETLARRLFPGESPVGKRVKTPVSGKEPATVVGVVGDVRHRGLDKDVSPEVYAPYRQNPLSSSMSFAIRSRTEPASLANASRSEILKIDPGQPVYDVMAMEERLSKSVASRRFNLALLSVFALVALALASIGVYGVIASAVSQRTHEIGIRVALGALKGDVLGMIIRQGMALVGVGVLIGLIGAFALTRVMRNMLYSIGATDPVTFVAVTVILVGIALLACYIPARRATRIEPVIAIRRE